MKNNKYNKEFSNYISIMKEALERENFEAYDAARVMLDESIEERKEQKALEDQVNTTNFGILNHIFEERLPELFKNNKKAPEVIASLPADRIMLETDCPYLAPVPFRGKRCDSSLLPHTAAAVAAFRGVTAEEIELLTWRNACAFFGVTPVL